MTRESTRRRVLYVTGVTSLLGIGGTVTGDEEHDDDGGHGGENGDHDEGDHDTEGDYESPFNHADVEFMQMMIPHHEQAIEMARLIPGRTDQQELCDLGPEIIEVQEAEIEQLQGWLEEAGADEEHEMDHGEMDGMLTDDEFQELQCAEGQTFDCLFVQHMIHHHEGAIEMAEDVLEDGSAERIADLAEDVIDVQQAEIEEMEAWQDEWGC